MLLASLVLALVRADAAHAHASLIATEPAAQTVVDGVPRQITLRFNEAVEGGLASIRVLDDQGREVDTGEPAHPAGDRLEAALPADMAKGSYTVTWEVVSADTHAISGTFVFSVDEPTRILTPATAPPDTPRYVDWSFTFVRFLSFGLLLLCSGGVIALTLVLRDAPRAVIARLSRVLEAGAHGLFAASLAGLVLQGATATGAGIGRGLEADVLQDVAASNFGKMWTARAALALVLAATAWWMRRHAGRDLSGSLLMAAAVAAYLVMSPAGAGHARVAGAASVISDVVHVAAAAAWTGGLAFTFLALRFAGEGRWNLAARVVPRFSDVALGSVALLVVAGSVNGYVQMGAISGLWETTYGRLLLLKIGLVVPLLALGAYHNRRAVPRLREGIATTVERLRFLRLAGAELAIMVAVVAVTAVLVVQPPKEASAQNAGPFTTVAILGPYHGTVTVTPAVAGPNVVRITLEGHQAGAGRPDEVTARASLPSKAIAPIDLTLQKSGADVYTASGAPLTLPGEWQLEIDVRKGEFDQYTDKIDVPIQ